MENQKVLRGAALALTLLCISLAVYCAILYQDLPNINGLNAAEHEESHAILGYEDIPDNVVSAFVAAEDKNFFTHNGIDYRAILRAIGLFTKAGEPLSGASTITMQLAKNRLLGSEKSFKRKLSQFLLARKIENNYSKKEIMTLYLNVIYFGNGSYGLEAATKLYFAKSPKELTLSEAAVMAGTAKAPSQFNPSAPSSVVLARRNWVLSRMLDNKFIDQIQFEQARSRTI